MVSREQPEPVLRAVVLRAHDLTPSLRRVVLGGPGLAGFTSTGVGDEYVRLLLPGPDGGEPVPRTYTVRRHDPARGEVTLDLVVHQGGLASTWACTARPGDVVGLTAPTALHDPPPGLRRQVLVADCAGLPALARILETTPGHVRTRAVVEVPGDDHRLDLPGTGGPAPRVEVTWVHGGNGRGPSRLEEVVRSLPLPVPGPDGYVWVAGESAVLRGVRRHLRRELGLPASAYKAVGYWVEDGERWSARWSALDEGTKTSLAALWDQDRPEEEIQEEYDERLAALGL